MKSVRQLRALPELRGSGLKLSWQNPLQSNFTTSAPFVGIRILRAERTYPEMDQDGTVSIGKIVYDGAIVSRFFEEGLSTLTTYYYAVYTKEQGGKIQYYHDEQAQVAALSTAPYQLAERLYRLLPAVHLREDRLGPADIAQYPPEIRAALALLPRGVREQGPLRRFMSAFAAPFDLMRSTAEALRQLHDIDLVRPEYLHPLSQWVGWEIDRAAPIYSQRNETRSAAALYRSVGTIPNLRGIVTRYTGWYAQVAELSQQLAVSNHAPQRNVFSIVYDAGVWHGSDDAATLLGFGPKNADAHGSDHPPPTPPDPAILTGTTSEPFALRLGMEFTVLIDNRIPATVRFLSGDFADISRATATEVATVLNRELSELGVTDVGGQLVLRTSTRGRQSSLLILRPSASLLSLEGAPSGRLSTVVEPERIRLFYEAADPLDLARTIAARQALFGGQQLGSAGQVTPRADELERLSHHPGQVRYKTFRNGAWSESAVVIPPWPAPAAQGSPSAVMVDSKSLMIAWIDDPCTDESVVRFALGQLRTRQPARLRGQRSGPFTIEPGTRLLFFGNWPQPEGLVFVAGDVPASASAADVAKVLNSRLTHVRAAAQPDNTILFSASAAGGNFILEERLELDLRYSSAAAGLGFDDRNALAVGDWGDGIDIEWSNKTGDAQKNDHWIDVIPKGRHADLFALLVGREVWLFFSTFVAGKWWIAIARWDGSKWLLPTEHLLESSGANREPCAVIDDKGQIWVIYAQYDSRFPSADNWSLKSRVFDPLLGSWSLEESLTPTGASDREPSAIHVGGGELTVFFSSNRASGGHRLFSLTLVGGTARAPAPLPFGPAHDRWPTPISWNGQQWLFYRSDRSLPLSKALTKRQEAVPNRINASAPAATKAPVAGSPLSFLLPDSGTLRRYAGTTSVPLLDSPRLGRRRRWDDYFSYATQDIPGPPLKDDDLYTRGTVGIFLSQLVPDGALARQRIERLRPVLRDILPINVRAVVVLAPRVDIEYVYGPQAEGGVDIEDSYRDEYPFVETLGELDESWAAALPDWLFLLSNKVDHVSADPTDLTTLRRRTYYQKPK